MSGAVRPPVVAGQFYPGREAELRREIEEDYLSDRGPGSLPEINPEGPRRILGLVVPHAGYFYSGAVAATAYAELAADGVPDTVVILGPSHRLGGMLAAIQTSGAWRTPLGDATLDEQVGLALTSEVPELLDEARAFAYEHSLEVQVPFLQHLYGEALRIVPIMMVEQDLATARLLAGALEKALRGKNAVMVASTDMTHMEPPELARGQDLALADHIRDLDAEGLLSERAARGITMCGYGPTATMILAARGLGATRGEVLAYHHSGEVAPMPEVVGYLAAKVER